MRESVAREQRVLKSMVALSRDDGAKVVAAALTLLPSADDVAARLRATVSMNAAQTSAAANAASDNRVPVFVDDIAGFLERRKALQRPPSLHPLMAYEALNFVDGSRTIGDVARAVAAEADLAGDWYVWAGDSRGCLVVSRIGGECRHPHPQAGGYGGEEVRYCEERALASWLTGSDCIGGTRSRSRR